jgi:glutamate-1-semialdehyde 2,1-aminomutase
VLVARYNDLNSVDEQLERCGGHLAAIVVEPIAANMGLVRPVDGFLEGLQQRARRCGALLIFDEVITWLRFGLAGAQARTAVVPDLTTLGKVLGGGLPIAAFGGRSEVMAVLAPDGGVFTGGTHAGNPFCVAMAHRVLDLLEAHPDSYAYMEDLARRLAEGLRQELALRRLPYAVVQDASVVDFKFRAGPPSRNYDDARAANRGAYARYCTAMLEHGVLLPPSQNEVMFLSTAHTAQDVDETLRAVGAALDATGESGARPA